ncbi:hypothetical protein Syn7502_02876 [Synechococcus sp. PCC 7502]|uniref:hypothetical protein n=1 Tax=Synechococcus sp. PCC 7502 TaxID=1173263 RepID=UPI00029FA138|nr:hypothetical protein [Synechococcus sp. PCC 7502]AFY74811.1 hypothetical protein Syn7502_02876 [Synechococcus sp. PCC 7502]
MPSFLNAIEDKLTAIEDFICEKAELESYSLGSFTNPTTLTLEPSTRLIKISVTSFSDAISGRFGRAEGQPNNYPFVFIAIILYQLLQALVMQRSWAFGCSLITIASLRILAIAWGLQLPIIRFS